MTTTSKIFATLDARYSEDLRAASLLAPQLSVAKGQAALTLEKSNANSRHPKLDKSRSGKELARRARSGFKRPRKSPEEMAARLKWRLSSIFV